MSELNSQDKKKLIVSILELFNHDMHQIGDADKSESLEAAIACISSVYEVSVQDGATPATTPYLEKIFSKSLNAAQISTDSENMLGDIIKITTPTKEDIENAENLKQEGNDQMKKKNYQAAIEAYSKAIEFNDEKCEYYCNRAAAYSKVSDHEKALIDAQVAIALKEDYARAHGRLGFAAYQLERYDQALIAYKRALELEPNNQGFQYNLTSLEKKIREKNNPPPPQLPPPTQPTPTSSTNFNAQNFGAGMTGGTNPQGINPGFGFGGARVPPTMGGLGGGIANLGAMGIDPSTLMNNPAFMNMANQLMSDPNWMNMAQQFMGQMPQQQAGGFPGMFNPMGQQLPQQPQQPPQPPQPPQQQTRPQQQQQNQQQRDNDKDKKKDTEKDQDKKEDDN